MPRNSLLLTCIAVAMAITSLAPQAHAADQKSGRLVVDIRPDVLLTAPASLAATAFAGSGSNPWTAQFALPAELKLRLAAGATAELTVAPLLDAASGVAASLHGEVSVNGVPKPIDTASPATVAFTASGTRQLAISITLHGQGALDSAIVPLRFTLRSSDGALNWTSVTELRWAAAQ